MDCMHAVGTVRGFVLVYTSQWLLTSVWCVRVWCVCGVCGCSVCGVCGCGVCMCGVCVCVCVMCVCVHVHVVCVCGSIHGHASRKIPCEDHWAVAALLGKDRENKSPHVQYNRHSNFATSGPHSITLQLHWHVQNLLSMPEGHQ